MARIQQVYIQPRSMERFEPILGQAAVAEVATRARLVAQRLSGRAVWNINSTPSGGGVAEMLSALLGYPREFQIDTRWGVIEGTPEFFRVTKRLHHALQGSVGDESPLDEDQRAIFEVVSRENADEFRRIIRPSDIVILHDPQTAGLAPSLVQHGCHVVWRCHIGDDHVNRESERGWEFLARYLESVPLSIFSRHAYVPPELSHEQAVVVPPSIDPFSAKSEMLDELTVREILEHTGLVAGDGNDRPVEFASADGTMRRVERRAHFVSLKGPPRWQDPMVLQVSRWDPLKDPIGVMDAFARLPDGGPAGKAHLMLVGPDVTGVADDPEAGATLEKTLAHWRGLPETRRNRIHLVSLPTADPVENAVMVNALQSHASLAVQKSLREGFGLTVTEAMWKACPIVASKVGGLQDQIDEDVEGLLVEDPTDLDATAAAMGRVLNDKALAERLGSGARSRVIRDFLPPRHLIQYAALIDQLLPAA